MTEHGGQTPNQSDCKRLSTWFDSGIIIALFTYTRLILTTPIII